MSSIRMPKQSRRRVSERKESFSNANKFSAKRELAMKWLHNIGTGHTVEKFNFKRKMVCQDHVTIDLEHRLLGLGERRGASGSGSVTSHTHRRNVQNVSFQGGSLIIHKTA